MYRDKDGAAPYYVQRMADKDGGKTFRQYSLNGDGTYKSGMEGVQRIPYRLDLIGDEQTLIIVEGEQCVEALIRQGYPATTNPGGAAKWQPELTKWFAGKDIIIIPDNDAPGRKHALAVATALHQTANTIIIADICAGLGDKADIIDWMQTNYDDIPKLYAKLHQYPQWSLGDDIKLEPSKRTVRGRGEIVLKMDANWTVRDILPATGMVATFGPPGSGKTFWALDLAMHIAAGVGYNGRTTKHGPVLYVPLEGGAFDNRVLMWCKAHDRAIEDVPIYISDEPLNLLDSKDALEQLILLGKNIAAKEKQPIKAVIIDTLSRAMAGGNENEPQAMTALIGNGDEVWKTLDTVVMLVHHTGKDETRGLRGHSSLHGAVDTMIEIKSISDTTKSARIAKQRNGEDGMSYGFSLEIIDIGTDSEGEMLTTCTVHHMTGEAFREAQDTKLQMNDTQRMAMEYFSWAAEKFGQTGCPEPGMNNVLMVPTKAWADRCKDKRLSKDGNDKSQERIFRRAQQDLGAKGIISQFGEWTWRVSQQADSGGT